MDTLATPLSALERFVEDELLRAPMLFDLVVDGTLDALRKAMPAAAPLARTALADLVQALRARREAMSEYHLRSLREQTAAELQRSVLQPAHAQRPVAQAALALVDEEEVAVDVELAHTIEAIKAAAEYELQELQTFVSALVGDMDVAHDHNPLRAETHARALWASAQALGLSRGHQVSFMRHAGAALAQGLRMSYAAACARLEAHGVEPAAYRTLILPSGSRRGPRSVETTLAPALHDMRRTMTAQVDAGATRAAPLGGQPTALRTPGQRSAGPLPWREVARKAATQAERQVIELVSRLFEAIVDDERVPADMQALIASLHPAALRLTLRDGNALEDDSHPLWRFVHRMNYEAEMAPDPADPERGRLLKVLRTTIAQLDAEPVPTAALCEWATERLDAFLQQRLTRRLAGLSSQVATLHKLEDKLTAGVAAMSTLAAALDMPQLDTVPADLMASPATAPPPAAAVPSDTAVQWLEALRPGDWVRMFIQGRWVRAQLLWPGERREVWLFGDGASDATWAVRRRALLAMHAGSLMKTLRQRSVLRSAAARVRQQLAEQAA